MLHLLSWFTTEMARVVPIPLHGKQGPVYFTLPISWLQMTWRCQEPGHQQPWYWFYRHRRFTFQFQKRWHNEAWIKYMYFDWHFTEVCSLWSNVNSGLGTSHDPNQWWPRPSMPYSVTTSRQHELRKMLEVVQIDNKPAPTHWGLGTHVCVNNQICREVASDQYWR